MLARQPTFRSWFFGCSRSAFSEAARVAGSVWSCAAAATMAGATAPGPVRRSCAAAEEDEGAVHGTQEGPHFSGPVVVIVPGVAPQRAGARQACKPEVYSRQ
jgi:hypothetical protein